VEQLQLTAFLDQIQAKSCVKRVFRGLFMNRSLAQVFRPAGSGDFRVARTAVWKARRTRSLERLRYATKPAKAGTPCQQRPFIVAIRDPSGRSANSPNPSCQTGRFPFDFPPWRSHACARVEFRIREFHCHFCQPNPAAALRDPKLMTPFAGEIVGSMLLVLLGDGVVANVLLRQSKGNQSGWIVITAGWAFAVYVGAFAVARVSGAHLNPAVSIGLAVTGAFRWEHVPPYILAQFIGGFLGAVLVWLAYLPHWHPTPDVDAKRGVFCTAPAIRNAPSNLLCEIIGTFVLVFGLLTIKGAFEEPPSAASIPINLGAVGVLPVAILVWAIGLSLGGPTGYAINPARDLAPRLAHAVLPIAGKGHSDWGYAWIPVVGPIVGALVAGCLYVALGKF
jgi:glycerol uptake facilitator protein